jgi:uncharacterized membrane protein YiaA
LRLTRTGGFSILLVRIGHFFLVIGLFIFLVFLASDQSQIPQYGLFFVGLLLSILGIVLSFRFREKPQSTERFRALRKISGKSNQKK